MFKVLFEDNDDGRQRFEMSFQAVALSSKQVPVSDWPDVVDLVKKLKSIGTPAKEKIGAQTLYDLQDGGGEILLEKGEMKLLLDFIGQPIWRPLVIEDALSVKKWLEALPKENASLRRDARPEEKRRANQIAGSISSNPELESSE